MNIGQNILLNRTRIHLTQEQLSAYLNLTKATISKWENNQALPDINYLILMAKLFDISLEELVGYKKCLSAQERKGLYRDLETNKEGLTPKETFAQVEKLCKNYINDYQTLLILVQFMLNAFFEDETLRKQSSQLGLDLLNRIISHASAESELQAAIMLKVIILFQDQKYDQIIEIYENRPYKLGEELFLANSYALKGNISKSKQVLQVEIYQQVLLLMEYFTQLISYEEDQKKKLELISRAQALIETFDLEQLHPNTLIKYYYGLALYYLNSHKEKTYYYLDQLLKCLDNLLSQFQLHGDSFFYAIDDWLNSLPIGILPPINKELLITRIEEMFQAPPLSDLQTEKTFQAYLTHLEDLKMEIKNESKHSS
ncbi:helix-turn-helix domain-containing protein [Streptococcus catagoni]|uniref:helix-turn-helix domain-containing protein n=1 Tax=Streptococcus catagoni TaxID=2654874 RepID=UPI001407D59D|nr:helix-turn-helix transcriptional regulator [Streptococcus catagoni]